MMFHAEVVRRDGQAKGYVRAASYGHTLGGAVGLVILVEAGGACRLGLSGQGNVGSGDRWGSLLRQSCHSSPSTIPRRSVSRCHRGPGLTPRGMRSNLRCISWGVSRHAPGLCVGGFGDAVKWLRVEWEAERAPKD